MPDQFEAAYPGPCGIALELHEGLYGPAPYGEYACVEVTAADGTPASLVYLPSMEATYMVQVEHTRLAGAGSASIEDPAVTTHHWRWGNAAAEPVAGDFAAVEARLDGFWTAIQGYRPPGVIVASYRWYLEPRAPGTQNPAIRTTLKNLPGTATQVAMPPQLSATVTEITDVRRRWGRFYVPGLTSAILKNDGMIADGPVGIIADSARTMMLHTLPNWKAVVFGALEPRSLQVRQVRVDNVWDIQRRRRPDKATVRETRTL